MIKLACGFDTLLLGRAAAVISLPFFFGGVALPFVRITAHEVPFWNAVFRWILKHNLFGDLSIIGVAARLYQGTTFDMAIATIIVIFSVLLPFVKSVYVIKCLFSHSNSSKRAVGPLLQKLIIWSTLDVFVAAVLIAFTKSLPIGHFQFRYGAVLFLIYVVLGVIAKWVADSRTLEHC